VRRQFVVNAVAGEEGDASIAEAADVVEEAVKARAAEDPEVGSAVVHAGVDAGVDEVLEPLLEPVLLDPLVLEPFVDVELELSLEEVDEVEADESELPLLAAGAEAVFDPLPRLSVL